MALNIVKILKLLRKVLLIFDDTISDMITNKKNSIVTEQFIRGRKLNISPALLHTRTLKYLKMLD